MRNTMILNAALLACVAAYSLACSDAKPSSDTDASTEESPAATAGGGRIYASVSGAAEVVVLDDATHAQLASIPVGKGPAIILATSDYAKLYTANWGDNSVSAIDAKAQTSKAIGMPGRPYVIALSPDGKRLYAGVSGVNEIEVIDTTTDRIVDTFAMSELPASIIVSPDGATLYVAFLGGAIPGLAPGSLLAVSATTGDIVHPALTVGLVPAWITMGPDGSKVYTLNFLSDDISVVDTASWKVDATIEMGTGSQTIIGNVTPDGSALYVTNFGSAELVAIDTKTNAIARTIKLSGKPVGVNFSADGKRVYTTDFGTASIGQDPLIGLNYLLTGVYSGGGTGQVRAFDVASGEAVGSTASTGPGATSVVVSPAAE